MPFIQLTDVSFAYTAAAPLFVDSSISLGEGWTGIVGANGGGKTTLLRLILGDLEPDVGHIERPTNIVFCPQTLDEVTPSIRRFASSWETSDFTLRGRLGLESDDLERWPTLSPGERKRWQIGAALSGDPDALLLDEPTNHIDAQARGLLLDALERFTGVGLIVSHDRSLLNQLCVRTARVTMTNIELWSGSYDTARVEWERELASAVEAKQSLRAEERRLRQRSHQQRQTLEKGQAAARRTVREAGVRDKDARSMEAKGRREAGAAAGARRVTQTSGRMQRVGEAADALNVAKQLGGSVFVDFEPSRRPVLLEWDGPVIAGGQVLVAHASVALGRDDRVWLRGPNGSGKTTLLTSMLHAASLPTNRVLWLPQDQTAAERAAVLATVAGLDRTVKGRVLSVVAALGVDPDQLLASVQPSPGEARKLTLALGLGGHAWCLVLDEPTNHLDLPSIERLEVALAEYPGALLIISHDESFADPLTSTQWTIEDHAFLVD